jgi:hypothetical protein
MSFAEVQRPALRVPGALLGWIRWRAVFDTHIDFQLHVQVGLAAANPGDRLTQDVQARSASAAAARI